MATGLMDVSWDKRSMLSGPDLFVRTESEFQVGPNLEARWKSSAHRQT